MKDRTDEFWDIIKGFKQWSITKVSPDKSMVCLQSKEKPTIIFYFNPAFITDETITKLKKQIKSTYDYWDIS